MLSLLVWLSLLSQWRYRCCSIGLLFVNAVDGVVVGVAATNHDGDENLRHGLFQTSLFEILARNWER